MLVPLLAPCRNAYLAFPSCVRVSHYVFAGRLAARGFPTGSGGYQCHGRSPVKSTHGRSTCRLSFVISGTCDTVVPVRGSLGQLLIAQGAIDSSSLSDALSRQSGRHPI